MHNFVQIDSEQDFQSWLDAQPTFSQLMAEKNTGSSIDLASKGQQISQEKGCFGCHSIDGNASVGPTWKDMYGKTEKLENGKSILVDDAYLKESILNPNAKIVKGYAAMMPASNFSEEELNAFIAYAKQLASNTESNKPIDKEVLQGQHLAQSKGCLNCHSIDGSNSLGPTWQGLFGKKEIMGNGKTITVDEAYLAESIRNPTKAIVKGYSASMPAYDFSKDEIKALIAYTKTL
jgi:cytochrome c oxidase subunit 2